MDMLDTTMASVRLNLMPRECRRDGNSGRMEIIQCIAEKRGWIDPDTGEFCLETFEESMEEFFDDSVLSDDQKDAIAEALDTCLNQEDIDDLNLRNIVRCLMKACINA